MAAECLHACRSLRCLHLQALSAHSCPTIHPIPPVCVGSPSLPCPFGCAQAAGSLALLQPTEQKDIATVVKDYLLLQRIRSELKDILKREPRLEEWALAAKMEAR